MGRLNYPQQQQPDIEPDQLSLMVSNMAELERMEPVNEPEEIRERLDFFFDWCSRKQLRPTVSLMCLCLGHPRQTLWTWQQRGGERGALIDRAKQLLEALTETWLLTGKTNPVSGIFILKSQFGFKDTVTIESATPAQLYAHMTPEQIAERISQDIPIDDYDLPEEKGEEEQ